MASQACPVVNNPNKMPISRPTHIPLSAPAAAARAGQLDRTSRPRRLDRGPACPVFAAPRPTAFFLGGAVPARTTSDVVSSTRLLEVSVRPSSSARSGNSLTLAPSTIERAG